MNALTTQKDVTMSKLDLSVVETMRKGNNFSLALAEKSREVYHITGKQFNDFLAKTGQGVTGESIKAFLKSHNWQPTTFNLKRQALINIIQNQRNFQANYVLIAATKELFKKEIKRVKVSQAVTEDEYLTIEKIEKLKAVAGRRLALIIEFFYETGCRVSEAINVRWKDVKLNGVAKIEVVGKGEKQRVVYAKAELIENIKRKFNGKKYIFETRTGTQFNRRNLFRDIREVGLKAGFTIHPHTFRHSCAMRLKAMGKEADYIQEYLGHADVATTIRHYFHNKPGAEVVELF